MHRADLYQATLPPSSFLTFLCIPFPVKFATNAHSCTGTPLTLSSIHAVLIFAPVTIQSHHLHL